MRNRYFARSAGRSDDQPSSNAARAAATARSTSSGPACATSASDSSVAGEIVGNHLPRARLDVLPADEEPVALLERDDVARLRRRRVLPLERGRHVARFGERGRHQSSVK